jgi:guanylate kinase
MTQTGLLIVLSGPSGAGKGTVCNALRPTMPELNVSISATTRQPRAGEREGVNYFFKTVEQFKTMVEQNELLEWAQVYGNYYGTPRQYVEQLLAEGKDVLLEIDIQGALQVKKQFPDGVFIFLVPPSLEELRSRIIGRGTETEESFRLRFGAAASELKYMDQYDYVVVNDQVPDACRRVRSIIEAERCSVRRHIEFYRSAFEN